MTRAPCMLARMPRRAVAPRLFTPDQAAAALAVGRSTVYKMIRQGRLHAVKVPGIYGARIPAEDIDALLKAATPVAPTDEGDGRKRSRRSAA